MESKYVPIEDVAKHFSVSVSTIRAWVRQEQIPQETYIRVGNTYRFCIPDISEALTGKKYEIEKPVEAVEPTVDADERHKPQSYADDDLLELLDDDQ
jgi:DNA-binding transcriptional MerR regulator|tara:strand:- start:85 stop:375 length:291 start_codon:yes stop_codon:yes gene_type:complete